MVCGGKAEEPETKVLTVDEARAVLMALPEPERNTVVAQFTERARDYRTWLTSLRAKLVHQLKVTLYTVQEEAEVGVIFEVLNNRGKPLSELEKVKNYLLYLATKLQMPNQLATRVNEAWTNIFERLMDAGLTDIDDENQLLRAHWLMAYDFKLSNWARSWSIKQKFNLKEYAARHPQFLQDLLDYTRTLENASLAFCDAQKPTRTGAFSKLGHQPKVRGEIIRVSEKLRRIKVIAPFLPLLMAVRLRRPEHGEHYLEIGKLCEVYAFRVFRMMQRRSNTGQARLVRLGHWLFKSEITFENVATNLRGLLLMHCPTKAFEAELGLGDDWNDRYNWSGLKYFLYEYEEHLARNDVVQLPWETVDRTDLQKTIEHILPQTPTDSYWKARFNDAQGRRFAHDIGNLSLTSHNSSYSNKPFPDKRGVSGSSQSCYANSNLFMERALAGFAEWDEASLLRRRQEIVDWALKRWYVDASLAAAEEAETETDDGEDGQT